MAQLGSPASNVPPWTAVECAGLSKSFGPVRALDHVDLEVRSGGVTALLGPSGCGKTTLLRLIAGFDRPDDGSIRVEGRSVSGNRHHVAPEERRIGVVSQDGALFPHLTVAGNVAYGLARQCDRRERVESTLRLCQLEGLGARMPHELSGGQQQLVALGRALAPRPAVVLFDEPFSRLDALLRVELRREVAGILRRSGQTAVLVTHDQGEALSMADHLVVLRGGRVIQHGAPAAVYRYPADPWVAEFVGGANVLSGRMVRPGVASCALGELDVAGGPDEGRVRIAIRPEQLRFVPGETTTGRVERCEYHGHDAMVTTTLGDGTRLVVRSQDEELPSPGNRVAVACAGTARAFTPAVPPG
ncbi:MAG: ABC transporter ATP-binding protein [Acidimicrobiales bacterium]